MPRRGYLFVVIKRNRVEMPRSGLSDARTGQPLQGKIAFGTFFCYKQIAPTGHAKFYKGKTCV
jgi:hypothetical protein